MTARKDWFGAVTGAVAFNPHLSLPAVRVYVVLVMYRNRDDDTCFPSNSTLAKHTGLAERTVIRALGELASAGIIERQPQFRDGRQINSLTTLTDWSQSGGGDSTVTPGGDSTVIQNRPSSNTMLNPDSSSEVSTVETRQTKDTQ